MAQNAKVCTLVLTAEEVERLLDTRQVIEAAPSPKDCVPGADIVVTATPSRKPLVMNEWVSKGTHINCIGADAPGKQEMGPMILKRSRLVIDDWEQASHSGEINVPLHAGILSRREVHAEIGELVAGLKPGRRSEDEATVFCSTGLAVQDCVAAKLVYDAALRAKTGTYMRILP